MAVDAGLGHSLSQGIHIHNSLIWTDIGGSGRTFPGPQYDDLRAPAEISGMGGQMLVLDGIGKLAGSIVGGIAEAKNADIAVSGGLSLSAATVAAFPSEGKILVPDVKAVFGVAGNAVVHTPMELQDTLSFALQNHGDSALIGFESYPEGHAANALNSNGTIHIIDNQWNRQFPIYSSQFYDYTSGYDLFRVVIPGAKP